MGNICCCISSGVESKSKSKFDKRDKEKEKENEIDLTGRMPKFNLKNQVMWAYCTDVTDGDTAKFNLHTGFGDFQYIVRLSHIDCPEMKSAIPVEQLHAEACKEFLIAYLHHRYCIIRCGDFDKYGRLLGEIFVKVNPRCDKPPQVENIRFGEIADFKDQNYLYVNGMMLRDTSAVGYEGRKKQPFNFDKAYSKHYHTMVDRLNQVKFGLHQSK